MTKSNESPGVAPGLVVEDAFLSRKHSDDAKPGHKNQAFCICGIDPGLSGGVAFFFPAAPDRIIAEDMPVVAGELDCATLAARIRQMRPDVAIVERVASMPGQGVSSTFKFGRAFGSILGVLAALEIRTVLVAPAVWKKHFRLDSDKEKGRALALRTFAKTPEHFSRKRTTTERKARCWLSTARRSISPPAFEGERCHDVRSPTVPGVWLRVSAPR
jgi:hypothetical protein